MDLSENSSKPHEITGAAATVNIQYGIESGLDQLVPPAPSAMSTSLDEIQQPNFYESEDSSSNKTDFTADEAQMNYLSSSLLMDNDDFQENLPNEPPGIVESQFSSGVESRQKQLADNSFDILADEPMIRRPDLDDLHGMQVSSHEDIPPPIPAHSKIHAVEQEFLSKTIDIGNMQAKPAGTFDRSPEVPQIQVCPGPPPPVHEVQEFKQTITNVAVDANKSAQEEFDDLEEFLKGAYETIPSKYNPADAFEVVPPVSSPSKSEEQKPVRNEKSTPKIVEEPKQGSQWTAKEVELSEPQQILNMNPTWLPASENSSKPFEITGTASAVNIQYGIESELDQRVPPAPSALSTSLDEIQQPNFYESNESGDSSNKMDYTGDEAQMNFSSSLLMDNDGFQENIPNKPTGIFESQFSSGVESHQFIDTLQKQFPDDSFDTLAYEPTISRPGRDDLRDMQVSPHGDIPPPIPPHSRAVEQEILSKTIAKGNIEAKPTATFDRSPEVPQIQVCPGPPPPVHEVKEFNPTITKVTKVAVETTKPAQDEFDDLEEFLPKGSFETIPSKYIPADFGKVVPPVPPPSKKEEQKPVSTEKTSPKIVTEPKKALESIAKNSSWKEVKLSAESQQILNILNPRAWFDPTKLHPKVSELVYWRDPKKSGAVFGAILVVLVALSFLSLISVVAYTSLAVLSATFLFRVYKNVLQAINKTQDGHPFKEYLELDLTVQGDKSQEICQAVINYANQSVDKLRHLFLVEDLVDSAKFAGVLYVLTYVGSCFNGLTLLILGFIALFALPKVYEQNKAVIDMYLDLVCAKVREINSKVTAALPFGNKEKAQ